MSNILKQKETYKKSILIGKLDGEILVIELEIGRTERDPYIAFTHDSYNENFLTEEMGEDLANERFEDGDFKYLWKEQVEHDNTELGYDDWIEKWKESESWFDTIGDVIEVDYDLYTTLSSCGALIWKKKNNEYGYSTDYNDLENPKISKEEFDLIVKSDYLHLKQVDKLNEEDKKTLEKVVAVFEKHKSFENEDLKEF